MLGRRELIQSVLTDFRYQTSNSFDEIGDQLILVTPVTLEQGNIVQDNKTRSVVQHEGQGNKIDKLTSSQGLH